MEPVLEKRFLDLALKEVPTWIKGNFTSKQRILHTLYKPFNSYNKRLAFTPLGPLFPLYVGLSFLGAYMNYDFNEAAAGALPEKKYMDQLRAEIAAKHQDQH